MKFSDLKKLSLDDIDLILRDQQDLYSTEEIHEIKEYREFLLEQAKKAEAAEKQSRRLTTVICPKCDGKNESTNTHCKYCNHQFKEDDYYAKKDRNRSSEPINAPIGRLIFGGLFSIAGIGSIIYGCNTNNSVEAQWDSLKNAGAVDPGTTWIILGAAAAVLGVILLASAFLSSD